MLEPSEYLRMRHLPPGPHVMYQRWRCLLFLHYSCPPEEIQPHLPPGLEVETFGGKAWIGLVPFRMEGIRPRFSIGVPGASAFPETNVRTYVHRNGRDPGVWFFSLDAASPLACAVARGLWRLPYHEAEMSVHEDPERVRYTCCRRTGDCEHEITAKIGKPLPAPEPGLLEFFLVERYLLYAYKGTSLYSGRVWHAPYPLHQATLEHMDEDLVRAAGLDPRPIESVLYSPGVDVRIFPLARVRS